MNSPPPPEFSGALAASRWDIDHFSEFWLGVRPHSGQTRLWRAGLMRMPDGWRARYLDLCASAGNRAGKTLGLAIYIFHSTLFKMGMRPPPPDASERELLAWMKAPYDWYHFGLQAEVAELVHLELVRILAGIHPAQQGRGCRLTSLLGNAAVEVKAKERGDYPWVQLHPALGGGQIHFRSTSERALGALGKEMNGVSWDECAFSSDFEFVVDEVLHLRRLGTGGQLVLISTSTEGLTAFTDRWNRGDPEAPDRVAEAISLRMSTRENVGYGIDQTTFDRLIDGMPEYLIPQNIDGFAIEGKSAFFGQQAVDQMFDPDMEEMEAPQPKHRYVQGVDPALTYDSTYAITLDMSDPRRVRGVRIKRKTGRQTTLSVSALIMEGHRAYTTGQAMCTTALDATGFGGAAFRDLLSGIHPFRAIEMGGVRSRKTKMLLDLKKAIEVGRLHLPRSGLWLVLRRQLLGYKLEDRKLETDAVIALAVAWSEAQRQPDSPARSTEFGFFVDSEPEDRVFSAYGRPGRVSAARISVLTASDE